MPGIETFAPERTDRSSGLSGSPNFLPMRLTALLAALAALPLPLDLKLLVVDLVAVVRRVALRVICLAMFANLRRTGVSAVRVTRRRPALVTRVRKRSRERRRGRRKARPSSKSASVQGLKPAARESGAV